MKHFGFGEMELDFDERDSGLNCKKTGKEIVLQFCPFSVLEDYVSKLYFRYELIGERFFILFADICLSKVDISLMSRTQDWC